jgi:hypothetical protein
VIAKARQICLNLSFPPGIARRLFDDNPFGSAFVDEARHFRPEGLPCPFALDRRGKTGALAGRAAGDEIEAGDISSSKSVDIVDAWDAGPMLAEDGSSVRICFAELDRTKSGSLESERKTTDAAEEVKYVHS